ncbi:MAG: hypothetical protein AAF638_07940 [Pseudomonadota bacterium]
MSDEVTRDVTIVSIEWWKLATATVIPLGIWWIKDWWVRRQETQARDWRRLSLIEALQTEIELIRVSAHAYGKALKRAFKSDVFVKRIEASPDYRPFVGATGTPNVAFDTFKSDIFFMDKDCVEAVIAFYSAEGVMRDYIRATDTERFAAMNKDQKLEALSQIRPTIDRVLATAKTANERLKVQEDRQRLQADPYRWIDHLAGLERLKDRRRQRK